MTTEPNPNPGADGTQTPPPGDNSGAPAAASDNADALMIPKARFDQALGKARELEGEVKAARDHLLAGIPEKLRPLAPAGGTVADLVAWIGAASTAGLFAAGAEVPATAPKPSTAPKGSDLSNLPTVARMAHGYQGMK